ncbi:MAG: aminodeoxychorismate/anthranilate synthase component II [Desulfobacterales bacterium]
MLVMIDNFDSFTYNLYQYLMQMGAEVRVARNNSLSVEELEALSPRGLIVSPGPGRPEAAGITLSAIQRFSGRIPVLGVCLGHQAIALAFGGRVVPAQRLMHGKTSDVTADGRTLFQGIPSPFQAMRYHSLAVARDPLPACLEISAESDDGEIMGIRHRSHPTEGVQFHPESIMTTVGKRLLRNFLKMTHQPMPV